jgi:hypothetical protein
MITLIGKDSHVRQDGMKSITGTNLKDGRVKKIRRVMLSILWDLKGIASSLCGIVDSIGVVHINRR